jgi:hypothetical protein
MPSALCVVHAQPVLYIMINHDKYELGVSCCAQLTHNRFCRIGVWGDPLQTIVCELVCADRAQPLDPS